MRAEITKAHAAALPLHKSTGLFIFLNFIFAFNGVVYTHIHKNEYDAAADVALSFQVQNAIIYV
jgi:hypothetical protein